MNAAHFATPRPIGLMMLAVALPAFGGQIAQPSEPPAPGAPAARILPAGPHAHGYLRAYEGPALPRADVALLGVRGYGQVNPSSWSLSAPEARLLEAVPHLTPKFGGEAYLTRLDGSPLYTEDTPKLVWVRTADYKHWGNVLVAELLPGAHDLEVVLSEPGLGGWSSIVSGSLRVHFDAKAGQSYGIVCATTGLYDSSGAVIKELGPHEGDAASVIRKREKAIPQRRGGARFASGVL